MHNVHFHPSLSACVITGKFTTNMSNLREVPERECDGYNCTRCQGVRHSRAIALANNARGAGVGTQTQKWRGGGAQPDSPTHSADPKLKSQSKSHPSIHWADESVTTVQMEPNPPVELNKTKTRRNQTKNYYYVKFARGARALALKRKCDGHNCTRCQGVRHSRAIALANNARGAGVLARKRKNGGGGGAQQDSPTHSADPKLKSQSKSHPSIHWADKSVTTVQMEPNPPL